MSKRKKLLLIIIPTVLVVAIAFSLLYFFYLKKLTGSSDKIKAVPQSTESDSAFGNLNKNPDNTLSNSDIEKMKNMDIVRNYALANPTIQAFDFLGANRIVQKDKPGSEPVLDHGEILLEVVSSNESKSYKVVASNNRFYNHSVGDEIPFDFTINYSYFMLQGADKGISRLYGREDYKIPESLSVGDRIVFICQLEDCSNNTLSWALIYRTYDL